MWTNPRNLQIISLAFFLVYGILSLAFPLSFIQVFISIPSVLICQYGFNKVNSQAFNWKSAMISALGLTILIRTNHLWVYPLMAFMVIAPKFFIKVAGKHFFNPVNFALVMALLFFDSFAWVSPGQWGQAPFFMFIGLFSGVLILSSVPSSWVALFWIGNYLALLGLRTLWLGDPWNIMFHHIKSGNFLLFSFFMITDPRTVPNSKWGKYFFTLAVAILVYILEFEFYIRNGLFYALFFVSMTTPFINQLLPGDVFKWEKNLSSSHS